MKGWLIGIGVVIVAVVCVMAFGKPRNAQYYNSWTKDLYCTTNCYHEIGHKLDDELGWKSKTKEYRTEVAIFLLLDSNHSFVNRTISFPGIIVPKYKSKFPNFLISGFTWGGYTELYAEMLNWADGEVGRIPEVLQKYYNQELIDTFLEDLTKEN